MSATATPTKRRVLGSLDANVQMSPRSPGLGGSLLKKAGREASLSLSRRASPSPRKQASRDGSPRKRPLGEAVASLQPAAKKLCTDDAAGAAPAPREQTVHDADENEPPASQLTTAVSTGDGRSVSPASPDASSLFDVSGMNTSQDTTITEPDLDAPVTTAGATNASIAPTAAPTPSLSDPAASTPPSQTRRISAREELRRKTEILRLRLSLANYKVKTGQVDVPLDRLQVRPVPGMSRRRTPLPSMPAHTVERSTPAQQWYRLASDRRARASSFPAASPPPPPASDRHATQVLPRLSSASMSAISTPRRRQRDVDDEEESLTSSALRGGAAKGLLSLSQGSVGRGDDE